MIGNLGLSMDEEVVAAAVAARFELVWDMGEGKGRTGSGVH
jgi:hypothetical protein